MVIARFLFLALALACIICFGLFIATGHRQHRERGVRILGFAVATGLIFFAVLAVQRLLRPA